MSPLSLYFVTCPKGVEGLLEQELIGLGGQEIKLSLAGLWVKGDLVFAYRVCLWSRLANRLLYCLNQQSTPDTQALYDFVYAQDWQAHMRPETTLWIDYQGDIPEIKNSQFGAQKVKDALVDKLRDQTGKRPQIEKDQPGIRLNVHVHRQQATLSLDLSGESLHRRGYRIDAGVAPLKENLAAAILRRAGWPEQFSEQQTFIDPLCGSGTFLIEAALMSADIAPGLFRSYFGFRGWLGHEPDLWQSLRQEALNRRDQGLARPLPDFRGYDGDPRVMGHARQNIERAGLDEHISVSVRTLSHLTRPTHGNLKPGLMVMNPPYGERLSDPALMRPFYQHLGERLVPEFEGWRVAIFTGATEGVKALPLRPYKKYALFNGTIPCDLLLFEVTEAWKKRERPVADPSTQVSPLSALPAEAEMIYNRLAKNLKQRQAFLKQLDSNAYRLYDADMPEYSAAIDCYAGYYHIQEYAPPKTIDPQKAEVRLEALVTAVKALFKVGQDKIILKQRRRQKGKFQYEALGKRGLLVDIHEEGVKCWANLSDYLDTGLFLDHRPVRRLIRQQAKNKRFLNLFAYTATASLHAAVGGARKTVSVDMSATYCDWARRQLALNGFAEPLHEVIQADCLTWLSACRETYDLILLDPPTFSNSKRMDNHFDVQADHIALIQATMRRLAPEGRLIFSNNNRSFKLDPSLSEAFYVREWTDKSFDLDFERDKKLHHVWLIEHR